MVLLTFTLPAEKPHLITGKIVQPKRCVVCGNIVCRHMGITDAGQRMSDTINNIRMGNDWDNIKDSWMAFALEDGRSDGTVYDTRDDAIRFHRNRAKKYFYCALRSTIHGMSSKEATQILALTRTQAERGRYNPTTERHDPIMPLTQEGYNAELLSNKLNLPYIDLSKVVGYQND